MVTERMKSKLRKRHVGIGNFMMLAKVYKIGT
jgi:hypothetical protein